MIHVILLDPRAHPNMIEAIPGFLAEDDPRPAAKQFDEQYQAGWQPLARSISAAQRRRG